MPAAPLNCIVGRHARLTTWLRRRGEHRGRTVGSCGAAVGSVKADRRGVAEVAAPLILGGAGDRWFGYPLPGPLHSTDVLRSLETLGSPSPAILKLAHYSD